MNDSVLLKTALAGVIIGIFSLFIILEFTDVDEGSLKRGDDVRVSGTVYDVKDFNKVFMFKVNSKDIVLFKDGRINIKEGDKVSVVGEVREYNGKLEIVGDEVNLIQGSKKGYS